MKKIKIRNEIYEQKVDVLDCIKCPYCEGCSSWGCVSPACSITNECFSCNSAGTWCPFGEIPADKKFIEIL